MPAPSWGVLYLSVAVTGSLGFYAWAAVPVGPARRLGELLTGATVFGLMALWVRVNRVALDCAGARPGHGAVVRRVLRSQRPEPTTLVESRRAVEPGAPAKVVRLQPRDSVVLRYDGR